MNSLLLKRNLKSLKSKTIFTYFGGKYFTLQNNAMLNGCHMQNKISFTVLLAASMHEDGITLDIKDHWISVVYNEIFSKR